MAKVLGITEEKASEIVGEALRLIKKEESPEPTQETGPSVGETVLDPVGKIEGVGEKTAEILEANGFKTVQDILKADVEKLSALPGIGVKKAEKLIQSARDYAAGKGDE